jgi:outer membrane murein-binding lipoprotein Lpp
MQRIMDSTTGWYIYYAYVRNGVAGNRPVQLDRDFRKRGTHPKCSTSRRPCSSGPFSCEYESMDKRTVTMTPQEVQAFIDHLENENTALREENQALKSELASLKDKLNNTLQRRADLLAPGLIVS